MRSLVLEELRIPLSNIKDGINEFDFIARDSELKMGDGKEFSEEIEVHAEVTGMGDDFLLNLTAGSEGAFICDRCSESFTRRIEGQIQTLLTFDRGKAGGEEDADADVRLLSPKTLEIELQDDVIDALALAIPNKMLCKDSCEGLCAQCGINKNQGKCSCADEAADPRWDALKNLNFEKND